MSDEPSDESSESAPAAGSILARLRAAGISDERARSWIASDGVRVDGGPVSDPAAPAPWPTPWSLSSP